MDKDHHFNWDRISELYSKALEVSAEEWELWLDDQCTIEEKMKGLNTYIHKLLKNSPRADAFFQYLDQNIKDIFDIHEPENTYQPGDDFDKFRIVEQIGYGGMSQVFLGHRNDGQFEQEVAIKIMKVKGNTDLLKDRFRQEQQILAGFTHPNIAQLYDGGITSQGDPYMIMEYVKGEPIDAYCRRMNLGIKERIKLFLQVCDALQYAHNKLVVHHDIKPANILVNEAGMVKLLDFGISQVIFNQETSISDTGTFTGTLRYASPEQFKGAGPTVASDIYKMGLVLFKLLTGDHYNQLTGTPGKESLTHQPINNLTLISKVPLAGQKSLMISDLLAIFNKSLSPDPSRRFITVSAMQHDLQNMLINQPLHSHSSGLSYRLHKSYERNKPKFWLLIGFNIALAVVGYFLVLQYSQTLKEKQKAEQLLEFVWNIFDSADPETAQGDTLTVYELLENSLPQIMKIKDQPDLQAEIFHTTGRIYTKMGFWQRGVELYHLALEGHAQLSSSSKNRTSKAVVLQDMAMSYRNLSKPQIADSLIDLSLNLHQKLNKKDNVEKYVDALNTKARILSDLARYDDCIACSNQALDMINEFTHEPHIEKVRSYTQISSALGFQSKYDDAIAFGNMAIAMIDLLEPGINSLKLTAYSTYAQMLARKGLIIESIEMENKIYDMKLEVYGENKPITLVTLSNLASRYFQLQDYLRADSINLIALKHYQTIFGDYHNFTNTTLYNLGNSYYYQGRFQEAQDYLNKSLHADIANLGPNHPYLAGTLQTIGLIHSAQNQLDLAEEKFLKALEILNLNFGQKHQHIATNYGHLANLYCKQGKLSLCKQYFEMALQMSAELLGEDHFTTRIIREKYLEKQEILANQ